MIASTSMGIMDSGGESITERIFDPYKDYIKGSFPSGKVQKIIYFEASNTFLWQEKISFTTAFYWVSNDETFDFKPKTPIFVTRFLIRRQNSNLLGQTRDRIYIVAGGKGCFRFPDQSHISIVTELIEP